MRRYYTIKRDRPLSDQVSFYSWSKTSDFSFVSYFHAFLGIVLLKLFKCTIALQIFRLKYFGTFCILNYCVEWIHLNPVCATAEKIVHDNKLCFDGYLSLGSWIYIALLLDFYIKIENIKYSYIMLHTKSKILAFGQALSHCAQKGKIITWVHICFNNFILFSKL